jgi:hypothetical protein
MQAEDEKYGTGEVQMKTLYLLQLDSNIVCRYDVIECLTNTIKQSIKYILKPLML